MSAPCFACRGFDESHTCLAELIRRARAIVVTDEERREQVASFAFGNLALTKEWADASPEKLAWLKAKCRQLAGCEGA